MKIRILCLTMMIPGMQHLCAQVTNVMIDNNFGPEEPSIAINPVNPSVVVAGSNGDNYYYSNDGGATWITGILSSSYGQQGDPCLVADSLGNLFYLHLAGTLDRIVCQASVDGGATYSNGSFAWNNNILLDDKEWGVTDPHTNNIYVTWTEYDEGFTPGPLDSSRVYFSKSTDHGVTFSSGVRINQVAGDCLYLDITDAHPFVGVNGEIYVTFMDSAGIRFNKSVDTGSSWLAVQPLIAAVGSMRYDTVPGVARIRSMPYSACDRSNSLYRGNLYVSWADPRNGATNSDIFFIRSVDGGATWSLPLKVNTDTSNRYQYRNAMTVDQTNGMIYIVYYDRRNYSGNDSTDVYLSKSSDGGATWTDVKLSSTGFYSAGIQFDGDYIDISAHGGMVRPVWTRTDNFSNSIWTCLYNEQTVGIPSVLSAGNDLHFTVNPNPADVVAVVSFAGEAGRLEGIILDASGRQVKSFSINHEREKRIDLYDLAAGVYFVKAGHEIKKLVIEK